MEGRREPRVLVRYPISFLGNQGVSEGTLFNLSMGGCAIESTTPVQLGAVLTLRVHSPSQDLPIEVDQAGVTWTAGQDFGAQFLRLEPRERDRLHRLINDLQQGTASA